VQGKVCKKHERSTFDVSPACGPRLDERLLRLVADRWNIGEAPRGVRR
jgi:hypothetical protein